MEGINRGTLKRNVILFGRVCTVIGLVMLGLGLRREHVINEKDTWPEETLYSKEEMSYTMLDDGVLDTDADLKAWTEEHEKTDGVSMYSNKDYTYAMISTGKSKEKSDAIQLYDVRSDKKNVYVGYNLVDVQSKSKEEDSSIRLMLIQFKRTDKEVVGKLILEKPKT